ncbi:MAG: lipid biosynthesis B12-binding/radical SAM protein [Desulfosudaceae bacterium]
MKVFLISANTETSPYPVYPLGIDYVAGAIESDHEVFLADLNRAGEEDRLSDRIKKTAPDIIGISIRNIDNTDVKGPKSYIDRYRSLIGRIRSVTAAPIVLGGSGFTIFPGQLLQTLEADYGIVGEGERFGLFLEAYENGGNPGDMAGVIAGNGPAPAEYFPQPWGGGVKRRFAPRQSHVDYYLKKGGMLNLQTKRGCPFKCIYCTYPHIEGQRLRLIPPREVAETALMLQNAGAGYLFITDSVFNSDYDHSLEVARHMKKAGLVIPWGAYIAPTPPPADYFKVLADSGMTHVEFGTEALCDEILKNYQKPFRFRHVLNAHSAAIEAGLKAAHFFLLGAPAETPRTLAETLDKAASLEQSVCFFFAGIRVYPHTRLHAMALESGQIASDQDLLPPVFYRPEGISLESIEQTVCRMAENRVNWISGAVEEDMAKIISRLHDRGHTGPLWEYLIR